MKLKVILVLMASALAGPVLAAERDSGVYVRLQGGVAQTDERKLGIDDRSKAFRAVAGYKFNRHWGVEGGVIGLGEATDSVKIAGRTTPLRLEASGFTLGGTAKLPLGKHEDKGPFIAARAGVAWLESKGRVLQSGNAFNLKKERKASGYAGVAAGYDFTPNFGVSLNVERFQSGKRAKADSTMISLGGEYRF